MVKVCCFLRHLFILCYLFPLNYCPQTLPSLNVNSLFVVQASHCRVKTPHSIIGFPFDRNRNSALNGISAAHLLSVLCNVIIICYAVLRSSGPPRRSTVPSSNVIWQTRLTQIRRWTTTHTWTMSNREGAALPHKSTLLPRGCGGGIISVLFHSGPKGRNGNKTKKRENGEYTVDCGALHSFWFSR